jgi:acyl-CoA synthetase (AMP-forming)/AMP-acid ligase II
MHTVFDFATKRAELSPEAVAFEEADSGRRVTFAAFNDRAERGAAVLEQLGIAAGERVAILCHNSATFFEVLFACGKAGAILVPLNWRQTPAELAPILADCGARLLLHDAATAALAAALAKAGDVRRIDFATYETLIDNETPAFGLASPPPSRRRRVFDTTWGRDREGGIAEHLPSGFPPPLTPPHKGEGNRPVSRLAVPTLRARIGLLLPSSIRKSPC